MFMLLKLPPAFIFFLINTPGVPYASPGRNIDCMLRISEERTDHFRKEAVAKRRERSKV